MADFPAFGTANRAAPLFQKEFFPNIQFEVNVFSYSNFPKTATIKISIVNLKLDVVTATLNRIFSYALESVGNEMNSSVRGEDVISPPVIHFEIDLSKSVTQGFEPGGVTPAIKTVKTANIEILVDNLPTSLLGDTLTRIKAYMSAAITSDLNP